MALFRTFLILIIFIVGLTIAYNAISTINNISKKVNDLMVEE
jgi:hypothetical protein